MKQSERINEAWINVAKGVVNQAAKDYLNSLKDRASYKGNSKRKIRFLNKRVEENREFFFSDDFKFYSKLSGYNGEEVVNKVERLYGGAV